MSSRRPERLSTGQARKVALAAQGLISPSRNGTANWTRINGAVARMNVLQIDSVNVLVRSHYLPVFSRVGHYEHDTLDSRTFSSKKRQFFEYWAHQASFVPIDYYPLLRWRMERAKAGNGTYGALARFATEQRSYVDDVLTHVRSHGPVTVADLPDPGERSGNWWGWGKGKYALEYLFDTGEVTASTRRGFERLYDIPERVIASDILNGPIPSEADAIRKLVDLSVQALGIGTKADIADYFRLLIAQVSPAIAEMVAEGTLYPVKVEGWDQPAYLHKDALIPRKASAQALVTPFDPIVWDRDRTERLFDFHYRIEIYTPRGEANLRLLRPALRARRPYRRAHMPQGRPAERYSARERSTYRAGSRSGRNRRRTRRRTSAHGALAQARSGRSGAARQTFRRIASRTCQDMTSHSDIATERLLLRLLPAEVVSATADGDVGEVARLLHCTMPADWRDVQHLAEMRQEQLKEDPDYFSWSIRAVLLRETNETVGYVNFHARPTQHPEFPVASNMAEIGYTIFAPWRRRGIAREALAALLHFAFENGADQAVLSIAPDNSASLRLASRFGFKKIGTQIDEIDGPEDVFLLPLSNLSR